MLKIPHLNRKIWATPNKILGEYRISTSGSPRMISYFDERYGDNYWWIEMKDRFKNKSNDQHELGRVNVHINF